MEKHNFKKKYGQNFLNNDTILEKIVSSFNPTEDGKILEVGPGEGALTKKLIKLGISVTAFEIDLELKPKLDKIISDNLDIIYGDFLNINLKDYFKETENIYVVANIPYYITTPIITKFIDEKIIPEEMVLMVQKEVGERLCAKPGNSEYGAITALLNYYFDIEYLFTVDRSDFYPVPNVDSAIIKFTKKKQSLSCNEEKYKKIINASFKQKRKNIKNNLKNYDLDKISQVLSKYNFDLTNRAEELSYEIFVELANIL